MEPMTRATQRPPKTVEDLLALGDEVRAELIAGEIYMSAAPDDRHQDAVLTLGGALNTHVRQHGLGRVFVAPLDVYLPSGDVVQPDVIFVSTEKASIVRRHVHGVPDLLVEVVSSTGAARDRIVKRDLFEASGVPEYWIVEPDDEAVQVLRLEDGRFRPSGYLRGEARLETPLVPGFAIAVRALFD